MFADILATGINSYIGYVRGKRESCSMRAFCFEREDLMNYR